MAESEIVIKGGVVVYEMIGPESGDVVVLTPGGRFSKDTPGVRDLAEALVEQGMRVLLWDRPNCGRSDVQLWGRSESHMRAEVLAELIDAVCSGPVYVAGGSGGARDSLALAILRPDLVRKLAVWSVSGGTYSLMFLAALYFINELRAVRTKGMEGVIELSGPAGSFGDAVRANDRNRERLLAVGAEEFEKVMNRWLDAFVPKPNEVIPGIPDCELEQVEAPTLIIRGGARDFDHPPRTSMELHGIIRDSTLIDPPWAEDAWEQAFDAWKAGEGMPFDPWPEAAGALLRFFDQQTTD